MNQVEMISRDYRLFIHISWMKNQIIAISKLIKEIRNWVIRQHIIILKISWYHWFFIKNWSSLTQKFLNTWEKNFLEFIPRKIIFNFKIYFRNIIIDMIKKTMNKLIYNNLQRELSFSFSYFWLTVVLVVIDWVLWYCGMHRNLLSVLLFDENFVIDQQNSNNYTISVLKRYQTLFPFSLSQSFHLLLTFSRRYSHTLIISIYQRCRYIDIRYWLYFYFNLYMINLRSIKFNFSYFPWGWALTSKSSSGLWVSPEQHQSRSSGPPFCSLWEGNPCLNNHSIGLTIIF
jgi:hypothetical protein